jgi:glutamate-1-semialdehyde 2,1-aminomutase
VRFGIEPDLTTLGKIVGGGMPIGAYGGRAALMDLVAPAGPVYQAGTLSGHPLSMAAGIATLDALDAGSYAALEDAGRHLAAGLSGAIAETGATASISRVGSLLTVFFRGEPPTHAEEALTSDRAAYATFFGAMLDAGILLPPSPFEAWFLSLAHEPRDVEATIEAAAAAFRTVAAA